MKRKTNWFKTQYNWLKNSMECACHKNKAKNINLLYNLPGPSLGVEASRPSRPRKRVGHDGKKPRERRENSKVPSCKDSRTQLCEDRKKSSSGSDTDIFQCIEIIHVITYWFYRGLKENYTRILGQSLNIQNLLKNHIWWI